METFEDEIDVYGKVYEMKWNAEFIPAQDGGRDDPSWDAGYEIDVDSIRHSFFGMWQELPTVPKASFERMIEEMVKVMSKHLKNLNYREE